MTNAIPFTKACALGNDFVIVNEKDVRSYDLSEISRFLGDRRRGIGCDQVIFVNVDSLFVRFFNHDGSEANSCGNGSRALALFLWKKFGWKEVTLKTLGGDVRCTLEDPEKIKTKISSAKIVQKIPLTPYEDLFQGVGTFVDIGNHHLIVNPKNSINIEKFGGLLSTLPRQLSEIYPKTVNVGFISEVSDSVLSLSVYERGVGPTPACGTGACAAAIAQGLAAVTVQQPGGDLCVTLSESFIEIEGKAEIVFDGQISLPEVNSFYAGTIVSVKALPNYTAEMTIDFGSHGIKTASAEVADVYSLSELEGRRIIGALGIAVHVCGHVENGKIRLFSPLPHLNNGDPVCRSTLQSS